MGHGRQSTKRAEARRNGDLELADALAPPSEKRLRADEKCGALTQRGNACGVRRGQATDHPGYGNCSKHGGNTEAGIKSAMKEMGHDLIQKYKVEHSRFGGNRQDPGIANLTPEQALLEEVRRSAAMVRFLEERIAHWNLTPVQQETVEEFATTSVRAARTNPSLQGRVNTFLAELDPDNPDSAAYLPALTQVHERTGLTGFTNEREWLYLYREERGHLARVAKMAMDAGVASRLVSIAEDQGRILSSAIRAVLGALNLSPEQSFLVPQIVPPILRAVASDSPIPDITSLLRPPESIQA